MMERIRCSDEVLSMYESNPKVEEALRARRFIELCTSSGRCINVYRGVDRDHIILRCCMCTCQDFVFNVLFRRTKITCYHIPALELAYRKGIVRRVEVSPTDFVEIIIEIATLGFSTKLRKLV